MFARKVSVRSVNRPEALSGGSYFAASTSDAHDRREGALGMEELAGDAQGL